MTFCAARCGCVGNGRAENAENNVLFFVAAGDVQFDSCQFVDGVNGVDGVDGVNGVSGVDDMG